MFKKLFLPLIVLSSILVFHSCEDKYSSTFEANVPIYKSWAEWRAEEIKMQSPEPIQNAGKIYIYQQYLLINDQYRGLHFYDNSDPANPVALGFLPVTGNVNMAIRNNSLYVDAFIDLLTIDVNDMSNPTLKCRREGVFANTGNVNRNGYNANLPVYDISGSNGVIVGWKQETVTQEEDGSYRGRNGGLLVQEDGAAFGGSSNAPTSVGIGGSMAQFTIVDSYLYTLEPWELTSYRIDGECPQMGQTVQLNRNSETIFPAKGHLFLGTTTGMSIYNISQPASPSLAGDFAHVNSCDPVVVQDDRAYVTLRSGTQCQGFTNELLVLDISNLTSPQNIASYSMTNPHGLGVDGQTLFLCDGADGLKVFDISDDLKIDQNQVGHYEDMTAYDVIPFNEVLIATTEEGIYQYDYSNPSGLVELSFIPVMK